VDPERAARTVADLAAISGADLTAEIRAAAADLFDRVETWRRSPGWSRLDYARGSRRRRDGAVPSTVRGE